MATGSSAIQEKRRRGPYRRYLQPDSQENMPETTRKRCQRTLPNISLGDCSESRNIENNFENADLQNGFIEQNERTDAGENNDEIIDGHRENAPAHTRHYPAHSPVPDLTEHQPHRNGFEVDGSLCLEDGNNESEHTIDTDEHHSTNSPTHLVDSDTESECVGDAGHLNSTDDFLNSSMDFSSDSVRSFDDPTLGNQWHQTSTGSEETEDALQHEYYSNMEESSTSVETGGSESFEMAAPKESDKRVGSKTDSFSENDDIEDSYEGLVSPRELYEAEGNNTLSDHDQISAETHIRKDCENYTESHLGGDRNDSSNSTASSSDISDCSVLEMSGFQAENNLDDQSGDLEDDDILSNNSDETIQQATQHIEFIPPNNDEHGVQEQEDEVPMLVQANHTKLKEVLQEEYLQRVTTPVTVSKGEALLMAINMIQQNNSTNKQLIDTIKLINRLFCSPILPNSSYLLDKLLLSECGAHRHFYCKVCYFYFGELDYKNEKNKFCENCRTQNIVHDLTKAPHFVIYDLSVQLELLLSCTEIIENLKHPVEVVRNRREGIYSDIYDGAAYRSFSESITDDNADFTISFTFCADGSPLFSKFSTLSIWPLFLSINELPPLIRMHNLLIGGLWFGNKEPPMDLFLLPFSCYMRSLAINGTVIKLNNVNKTLKAHALLCCVDSGARGQIQGLKTHAGYSSCNWCLHPGEWDGKAVKFPNLNYIPAKRTHEGIIERAGIVVRESIIVDGVNAATPLINLGPKFDLVESMVVEYLHPVLLGIVRQFLKRWMKDKNEPYYVGSEETVQLLNNKIKRLKPPVEVRRLPRSMDDRKHWNARDLENWLLFYSIPVLNDVLPRKYLDHWMLFVRSIYLLLLPEITELQLKLAQEYMIHFSIVAEQIYGQHFMTFNMHISRHLFDHVRRWGPLYAVSGFAFEAGNGTLKQLIHSQHGIPHQVCRSISLQMAVKILESCCSTAATKHYKESISKQKAKKCLSIGGTHYIGSSSKFTPTEEEEWLFAQVNINTNNCVKYRKVIKDKCLYSSETQKSRRTDNSVAQLIDQTFIRVKKIIYHEIEGKGYILGNKIHCSVLRRLPQDPRSSGNLISSYFLNVDFTDEDMTLIPIEDLRIACFHSYPVGNVLSPIPYLINVF